MSNTFITEDEFENKKMQVIEKLEKMLLFIQMYQFLKELKLEMTV